MRALRFRPEGSTPRVEAAATLPGEPGRDALKRLKREGWFGGVRVVLGVRQRETAVLPRPPVDDTELVQAMRWQLAGMLPFPPDEAIVDAVTLGDTDAEARRQVLVVAVHRAALRRWLEPLAAVRGLIPDCIDVVDLAQRNLVAAAAGSVRCVGCLTEREGAVLFTISRGRDLLYSRVFDLGAHEGDGDRTAERIGVQLQRAIDVLERRSPEDAPTQLLTGPAGGRAPLGAIAVLCGLPTELLDWRAGVHIEADARPALEADPGLIHLVGAALRPPASELARA